MKIDNKLILENSKQLDILYVEDDASLRESMSELLKDFFKSVSVGVDGVDGLAKYKRYLESEEVAYDIVITDIDMPHMSGLEMCEQIKEISFEQSVIFLTAYDQLDFLHEAINMGASGFLTKPIEINQFKKVLYTASQIVVDRKLVNQYYRDIEDQNMLSIDLKDARNYNVASDILEDLLLHKEQISDIWMRNSIVRSRLESYAIDVEFFRAHYGIKIMEYFLSVIQGDAEMGNCPVIFVMLDFFKNKNLALEDIFVICVHFKNSISSYIFNKYSFNQALFDDISLILDKNFEGVIVNYLELKKKSLKSLDTQEGKTPQERRPEHINYVEYVIESDIYELQDLEEDIDSLSISVIESSASTIEDCKHLGEFINRYGTILSNYTLFGKLGQYITKLGVNFTQNAELLFNDKERMLNISVLIEGFVNDLIVWRKEIFENNIENPHFLDSSFFSNVDTIIMYIEYDESSSQEESFDDDMFF